MSRRVVEMYELPKKIDTKFFDSLPEEERFGRLGIWELAYQDLRNSEITLASESDLWQLTFNEETIFPDAYRTMAQNVLKNGKGGRIRNSYGLTGEGIKVAVIDKPLQPEHPEFASKLTLIEVVPGDERNQYIDFHGMTCASLLTGKTCGAAPDAELVYFMIPNTGDRMELSKYALLALQKDASVTYAEFTRLAKGCPRKDGYVVLDMDWVIENL